MEDPSHFGTAEPTRATPAIKALHFRRAKASTSNVSSFQRHHFKPKRLPSKLGVQKQATRKQLNRTSGSSSLSNVRQLSSGASRNPVIHRQLTASRNAAPPSASVFRLKQRQQQQQQWHLRLVLQSRLHMLQGSDSQQQPQSSLESPSASTGCSFDTSYHAIVAAAVAALPLRNVQQQQDQPQCGAQQSKLTLNPSQSSQPPSTRQQQQLDELLCRQDSTDSSNSVTSAAAAAFPTPEVEPATAAAAAAPDALLPPAAITLRTLLAIAAHQVSPAFAVQLKEQLMLCIKAAAGAANASGSTFVLADAMQAMIPAVQTAVLQACNETQAYHQAAAAAATAISEQYKAQIAVQASAAATAGMATALVSCITRRSTAAATATANNICGTKIDNAPGMDCTHHAEGQDENRV